MLRLTPSSAPSVLPSVVLVLAALLAGGCSIRSLAVNKVGDMLASSTGGWGKDDDPELVRDALPFALKMIESLLAESPEHQGLLLTACEGFTQYTYAYVNIEAMRLEPIDYRAAKHQRERAFKLYLRGRDYCLRALELRAREMGKPGVVERLKVEPEAAAAIFGKDDVELLVASSTSWGAVIAQALDKPEIVVDVPAPRALLERAYALDPTYEDGAIEELLMAVEALPETMGGSLERARHHYERAIELSGGERPSTYVLWASIVSVRTQDREEFQTLLDKALAIDPDVRPKERLAALVYQEAARVLLDQVDILFL